MCRKTLVSGSKRCLWVRRRSRVPRPPRRSAQFFGSGNGAASIGSEPDDDPSARRRWSRRVDWQTVQTGSAGLAISSQEMVTCSSNPCWHGPSPTKKSPINSKTTQFGPGGKISRRVTRKLIGSACRVRHVEVGAAVRQHLKDELGIDCLCAEAALDGADVAVLAVPETPIGKLAAEISPLPKAGTWS